MQTSMTTNPFWEKLQGHLPEVLYGMHVGSYFSWEHRRDYCTCFSWAIPDPETLAFVSRWLGPRAIEIGAGTGYWAWLLAEKGCNILAFDLLPPDRHVNLFFNPKQEKQGMRPTFYPVNIGTPDCLANHADRTLFLCWPPYDDSMAHDAVKAYGGDRIVYIGEDSGGCTGDEGFFDLLAAEWHVVAQHLPIQWDGIHDTVIVFDRGTGDEGGEESQSSRPERPIVKNNDLFYDAFCRSLGNYLQERISTIVIRQWVLRVCPALARKYYPDFCQVKKLVVRGPRKRKRRHLSSSLYLKK